MISGDIEGNDQFDSPRLYRKSSTVLDMLENKTSNQHTPKAGYIDESFGEWVKFCGSEDESALLPTKELAEDILNDYGGTNSPDRWFESILLDICGEHINYDRFLWLWAGLGSSDGWIDTMAELFSCPWFFDREMDATCKRYLQGETPGTFLARWENSGIGRFHIYVAEEPSGSEPAACRCLLASSNFPKPGLTLTSGSKILFTGSSLVEIVKKCPLFRYPVFHPMADRPWFHGSIDTSIAIERLRGAHPGSFLVRFSISDSNYFAVSITKGLNQVFHSRFELLKGCVKSNEGRTWPTIEEFIADLSLSCNNAILSPRSSLFELRKKISPISTPSIERRLLALPSL